MTYTYISMPSSARRPAITHKHTQKHAASRQTKEGTHLAGEDHQGCVDGVCHGGGVISKHLRQARLRHPAFFGVRLGCHNPVNGFRLFTAVAPCALQHQDCLVPCNIKIALCPATSRMPCALQHQGALCPATSRKPCPCSIKTALCPATSRLPCALQHQESLVPCNINKALCPETPRKPSILSYTS